MDYNYLFLPHHVFDPLIFSHFCFENDDFFSFSHFSLLNDDHLRYYLLVPEKEKAGLLPDPPDPNCPPPKENAGAEVADGLELKLLQARRHMHTTISQLMEETRRSGSYT